MTIMFNKLKGRALNAIDTKDASKVHEVIGQVEMAYELGHLTWSQQEELTDMLLDALDDSKEW